MQNVIKLFKLAKLNEIRFYYILHFYYICILLHSALQRTFSAKCNKNNAKFIKFLSTWFILVVWSEIVEYDFEMFYITNFC